MMHDAERQARDGLACETANSRSAPPAGLYCEGTYDTWLCWPHTPAGTVAYLNCPDFIPGFKKERKYSLSIACCEGIRICEYRICHFICSVGAQGVHGEWHMVPASRYKPRLVQLHYLCRRRRRYQLGDRSTLWRLTL